MLFSLRVETFGASEIAALAGVPALSALLSACSGEKAPALDFDGSIHRADVLTRSDLVRKCSRVSRALIRDVRHDRQGTGLGSAAVRVAAPRLA